MTSQRTQKILPKLDYSGSLDEDDLDMPDFSPKLTSRPRVEIPPMSSKPKIQPTKRRKTVQDSDDDSDEFLEIDLTEEEDSDAPIPMSSVSRAKVEMISKSP